MGKSSLIAVCLSAGIGLLAAVAGGETVHPADPPTDSISALASDVERIVAHSKPTDWEFRRACLYYAFAGQYLLARQGIAATLWVGTVVYDPQTPADHLISPHAWLETATHFIDYSTLPRWGNVKVIPHNRVATDQSEVVPGATQVLALHRAEDPGLIAYLSVHRARFEKKMNGGE